MSTAVALNEIVKTYQNYGWTLRRVILTAETRQRLVGEIAVIEKSVLIETADINALWFSRQNGDNEAWELRALNSSPYALFESFAAHISPIERERVRREMEERLKKQTAKFSI